MAYHLLDTSPPGNLLSKDNVIQMLDREISLGILDSIRPLKEMFPACFTAPSLTPMQQVKKEPKSPLCGFP